MCSRSFVEARNVSLVSAFLAFNDPEENSDLSFPFVTDGGKVSFAVPRTTHPGTFLLL